MSEPLPPDLITIKEAARLVRNTNRATIMRWILKSKIRGWMFGRKYLVSAAEVRAQIKPYVPPKPQPMASTKAEHERLQKWSDEVLRAAGVK